MLAVAAKRSVLVWEVGSGRLMRTLAEQGGNVTALAYSPDGKYLAAAGADGAVILRDAQTHEVVGQRHLDVGPLGALCWLPDSQGLVVGGEKPIAVCELPELLVKETKPKIAAASRCRWRGTGGRSPAWRTRRTGGRWRAGTGSAAAASGTSAAGQGRRRSLAAFAPKHYADGPTSWSPDGERTSAIRAGCGDTLCDAPDGRGRSASSLGQAAHTATSRSRPRGVFLVAARQRPSPPLSLSLRDAATDKVLFHAEVVPDRGSLRPRR